MQVIAHAYLDRGDVVLWHHAAGDLVGELKTAATRAGLDGHHHVAELAMPTRLFFMASAHLGRFADEPPERDAELHLTPAPPHHLPLVLAVRERERGVLLDYLGDRRGKLHLV